MLNWAAIANFLGGIGLFLLGMRLMTDGLKVAAGGALHELLGTATNSPFRALLSGAAITALVQSSSAVIFATIGFVNSGLLSLGQAVGLIFGANLGTTLTSWIVALVGFKLDLKLFAMPLVALGTALWLTGAGRRSALGQALVGFGVFFLGLDVLKEAFSGAGEALDLSLIAGGGALAILMSAAIGIVLTLLMQSSSAALAVTLTAASQHLIALEAAAAMVVGANVGTTSTALFATLGATSAARRTAAAHVIFNLVAAAIALLLLPWLVRSARVLGELAGAGELPATILAIVHTQVNLLGILAVWPMLPWLVGWLEHRFSAAERADRSLPRHLDDNVLATPRLALDALHLELDRMGEMSLAQARAALSLEGLGEPDFEQDIEQLEDLGTRIIDFASRINSGGDAIIEQALPDALRVAQYYRAIAEAVRDLRRAAPGGVGPVADDAVVRLGTAASRALSGPIAGSAPRPAATIDDILAAFENEYQQCKAELLRSGSRGELRSVALVRALDRLSATRRIVEQALKATKLTAQRPTQGP